MQLLKRFDRGVYQFFELLHHGFQITEDLKYFFYDNVENRPKDSQYNIANKGYDSY